MTVFSTPRARSLVLFAMLSAAGLAACSGSSGSTGSPASTATSTAVATPASTASAQAPPTASFAPVTTPAASAGAVPFGKNVCLMISATTIDQTIGVHVSASSWDGHVCTWLSTSPKGGATIGWLEPGSTSLVGVNSSVVPAGMTRVNGLGLAALGRVQTGLPAPLAPTQAFLIVALPQGGLTVHLSGPAVTLDEAVTLAHDVLGA